MWRSLHEHSLLLTLHLPNSCLPPWSWNKLKIQIHKVQSLSMPKQRKFYWKSLFLKKPYWSPMVSIQFSLLIQNYLFVCNRINLSRAKTLTWVQAGYDSVGFMVKFKMFGAWTHMPVLLAKLGIIFMLSSFECNPRATFLRYHIRLKNWNNIVESLFFSCPILKFTAHSSSLRSELLYYVDPLKDSV